MQERMLVEQAAIVVLRLVLLVLGRRLPQRDLVAPQVRGVAEDPEHGKHALGLVEPDVWGTLTKRDSVIFHDNDFEIFIDPDNDQLNYIELEINPLNTFLDLFVIKPVVPIPYESYNIPAKWAVKVNGTVNNSADQDKGWTVELSMPLKEAVTAPHLPPKEGDKWRLNLYRIEKKPKEEYSAWSPTLNPSYHTPARFGEITFSNRKAGD